MKLHTIALTLEEWTAGATTGGTLRSLLLGSQCGLGETVRCGGFLRWSTCRLCPSEASDVETPKPQLLSATRCLGYTNKASLSAKRTLRDAAGYARKGYTQANYMHLHRKLVSPLPCSYRGFPTPRRLAYSPAGVLPFRHKTTDLLLLFPLCPLRLCGSFN